MVSKIELTDNRLHFHFILPCVRIFYLMKYLLHLIFTVIGVEKHGFITPDKLSEFILMRKQCLKNCRIRINLKVLRKKSDADIFRESDVSFTGFQLSHQKLQQSSLTSSIPCDKCYFLSFVDRKIDTIDKRLSGE